MNLKMSDFLFEDKDVQDLDKKDSKVDKDKQKDSSEDDKKGRLKIKTELDDEHLKQGPEILLAELDVVVGKVAETLFRLSKNLVNNAKVRSKTAGKDKSDLSKGEKSALKKAEKVLDLPLGIIDRVLLNKLFTLNFNLGYSGKVGGKLHLNPFQIKRNAEQIEGAQAVDFEMAKKMQMFFAFLSNEKSEIVRCNGKAVVVAIPALGANCTRNIPLYSLLYPDVTKEKPVPYAIEKAAFFLLPFDKFDDFQAAPLPTIKTCLSQEKSPAKNESFFYQKGISSLLLESEQQAAAASPSAEASDQDDANQQDQDNVPGDYISKLKKDLEERRETYNEHKTKYNNNEEVKLPDLLLFLDLRIGFIKSKLESGDYEESKDLLSRELEYYENELADYQNNDEEGKPESGDQEAESEAEPGADEEPDEEGDKDEDEEGESKPDLSRVRSESNFIVDFICESYLESIGEDSVETKNKKSREAKIKVKASKAVAAKQNARSLAFSIGAAGLAYSTGGTSLLLPALLAGTGFFTNIFREDNDKIQARAEAEEEINLLDSNSITMDSVFREIKSNIKIDKEKEDLFNIIKEIVKESKRLTERSQLMSLRFLLNEEDEQKEEKSKSKQKKKLQKISKDFVVRIIEEESLKLYDLIDQNERLTKKFLSKLSGLLRRNFDIQITDIVPESVVESARDQALSAIDRNAKKGQPASPAIDHAARVDNNSIAKAVNEVNHSGNSDLVASMLAAMIADPKGFGQLFNSLKSESKSGLQVILDFAKIDQDKVDVNELQGNVPEKIPLSKKELEKIIEKINKVKTYSIDYTTNAMNEDAETISYDKIFSDADEYEDLISKQFDIKDSVDSYYDNTGLISSLSLIKRLIFEKSIKQKIPNENDEYMTSYAVIQALNYIASLKSKMSLTFYEKRSAKEVKLFAKNDEIFLGREKNASNPTVVKDQSTTVLDGDNKVFKVVTYFEVDLLGGVDYQNLFRDELRDENISSLRQSESFVVMQGRELIKEWRELWNI